MSMRPDFCMLRPRVMSMKNSKISQRAPIDSANVNEKIAMAHGLPMIFCLLYMKYRIVKPMKPKMIAENPWSRMSHHQKTL